MGRGEVSGLDEAGTSTSGSLLLWPLPFKDEPAPKNLEVIGWVASRIWDGNEAPDRVSGSSNEESGTRFGSALLLIETRVAL